MILAWRMYLGSYWGKGQLRTVFLWFGTNGFKIQKSCGLWWPNEDQIIHFFCWIFSLIIGQFLPQDVNQSRPILLTQWSQVTLICINGITIIDSDNGLSPGQCQAIIWTNAGILLIGTLGTNFCEILSEIHTFSFKKMHLKMSSAKWRAFCLSLNVSTVLPFWMVGCF